MMMTDLTVAVGPWTSHAPENAVVLGETGEASICKDACVWLDGLLISYTKWQSYHQAGYVFDKQIRVVWQRK